MRSIPVPSTLVLANQVWTIRCHRNRETFRRIQRRSKIAGKKLMGLCLYETHEIHLAPHKDERALGRTFLHELLHACGTGRDGRGEKEEESFITEIEDGLAVVIEGMLSAPPASEA